MISKKLKTMKKEAVIAWFRIIQVFAWGELRKITENLSHYSRWMTFKDDRVCRTRREILKYSIIFSGAYIVGYISGFIFQ
jgi:hypothetical protein